MTVDAHLHIWDLERSEYAWLEPDLGPLYATFTAEQAQAELRAAGIASAVLVQAEDSERDTDLMLEAAHRHPWIAGVVGWVRLDDPETAERQLERWRDERKLCGVRHLVHDDPRDDFLYLAPVRRSLRLLAERGIPFDVPDAWPRHLAATADLAAALPDLRVVVDHLGKPPFGSADWERWRATLADVAARPNTTAKVSGLQAPGRPFTVDAVRPAWEAALDLFGPARLMWGSDWPLTVLVGGYAVAWEILSSLVGELSPDEQAQITSHTAESVYKI
jgi:L-fuconolactonase